MDEESSSAKRLTKLEKYINKYFNATYGIDDFTLSGLVFSTDIDVGSRENVSSYIKALQRVGKVKGFSPTCYDCFDGISSYCLEGNSSGIDFLLYDLEELLANRLRSRNSTRESLKSMTANAKGIIRAEVRLKKPKSIRPYTNEFDTTGQAVHLLEKGKDIFLNVFAQIVPYGDFYKKDKAVEIIRKEITDMVLRRRMLQLVTLIPEKKSMLLAQKALNYRHIENVMESFAKINLSPITISKRHDVKHLKNLYTCLEKSK